VLVEHLEREETGLGRDAGEEGHVAHLHRAVPLAHGAPHHRLLAGAADEAGYVCAVAEVVERLLVPVAGEVEELVRAAAVEILRALEARVHDGDSDLVARPPR